MRCAAELKNQFILALNRYLRITPEIIFIYTRAMEKFAIFHCSGFADLRQFDQN